MVLNALANAGLAPSGAGFWLLILTAATAVVLIRRSIVLGRRLDRLRQKLEEARIAEARRAGEAREADRLREELKTLADAHADLTRDFAAERARLQEREKALSELNARMNTDFRAAASKMLDETHKTFLQRADETFNRHRQLAANEAESKRLAMDDLIKPMSETLTRYEAGLKEMRAEQQEARGALAGQIGNLAQSANHVRDEAQKLQAALRAGPKVRGRWGEEQLRNVVELAGMTAHVDFVEQPSHNDGERRKQPDMVVSLPGGRTIAVDAKVSLGAYMDAAEAETDAARAMHLQKHGDAIRAHMRALATREYAASLRSSLDFVVMFVPGENYFAAAMEARPDLFQEAFDKKVLIATPTTLIAILKSAAYGWRQEKAAASAEAVAALAKDLYDSLRKMGQHLTGVGKALDGAVKKYNDLVGGVEQRVMPRARRFAEYELPGIGAAIEGTPLVESSPRTPRGDRDLLVDTQDGSGEKTEQTAA